MGKVGIETTKIIVLQFSFSNEKIVPRWLREIGPESSSEVLERKNRNSGQLVVEATENCSIEQFVYDLITNDYSLIDACYQKRLDPKDLNLQRRYHMVRYVFAKSEVDDKNILQDPSIEELKTLCEEALWRVRIFSNPLYNKGKEVENETSLCVNLEARKPLYSNGKAICVWPRNEAGEKIGSSPLPIGPDFFLRLKNLEVVLL